MQGRARLSSSDALRAECCGVALLFKDAGGVARPCFQHNIMKYTGKMEAPRFPLLSAWKQSVAPACVFLACQTIANGDILCYSLGMIGQGPPL